MGLIDRIKDGARSVADTVDDAAQAAAAGAKAAADAAQQAAQQVTSTAAQAVQATATASAAQFQQFRNDPGALARQAALAPARKTPTLADEVGGFLSDVGGRIANGGRDLLEAADKVGDRVSDKVQDGLRAAGRTAEKVGQEVAELRDGIARGAVGLGRRAVRAGEDGLKAAEEGLAELGRKGEKLGREALEGARDGARRIQEGGKELLGRVTEQLDPGTHIKKLDSEGDSVKIRLGGSAQVLVEGVPVRAAGAGELEVRKAAGGYEVDVSGQVGLGLYAHAGGQGGSISANAMLQGGAKVTLKFATQAEAERAVRVTARMAAVGAAGAAGGGPLGIVTGGAAQALVGPSADDMRFMASHMSAAELRGGIAAEVAGELGQGGLQGKISGKLGVSHDVGVRLNFPERDAGGRVTKGAMATVFYEGGIAAEGEAQKVAALRGGLEGKVTIEQTFQLPTSATAEDLLKDPAGTIRSVARDTRATTTSLKIEGQARAGAGVAVDAGPIKAGAGGQAGARFELSLTGDTDMLLSAAGRAVRGDLRGAVGEVGDRAKVNGEIGWFTNTDANFSPEIKDEKTGQGIGFEAQYKLHDRRSSKKLQEQSPRQAWTQLEQLLREVDATHVAAPAPAAAKAGAAQRR